MAQVTAVAWVQTVGTAKEKKKNYSLILLLASIKARIKDL